MQRLIELQSVQVPVLVVWLSGALIIAAALNTIRAWVSRREEMKPSPLKMSQKTVLADRMDDLFEQMLAEGLISKRQAREYNLWIAKGLRVPDMVPRRRTEYGAKLAMGEVYALANRIRMRLGGLKPVKLPGVPEEATAIGPMRIKRK